MSSTRGSKPCCCARATFTAMKNIWALSRNLPSKCSTWTATRWSVRPIYSRSLSCIRMTSTSRRRWSLTYRILCRLSAPSIKIWQTTIKWWTMKIQRNLKLRICNSTWTMLSKERVNEKRSTSKTFTFLHWFKHLWWLKITRMASLQPTQATCTRPSVPFTSALSIRWWATKTVDQQKSKTVTGEA